MSSEEVGYAKLSNDLVNRGILSHLTGDSFKVYTALIMAARRDTGASFPTLSTLSRWSGVPRKRLSTITATLEAHRLIERRWIRVSGRPRRWYRVVPSNEMPDLRTSCAVCDKMPDDRVSCVRDKTTGRLLGRRKVSETPEDRASLMMSEDRASLMMSEDRASNQNEPELTIRETEGARVASPQEAASLAPKSVDTSDDKAKAPLKEWTMPEYLSKQIEKARQAHLRRHGSNGHTRSETGLACLRTGPSEN